MPYYDNPTYRIENGILTIPSDCIKNIGGESLFSYHIPGSRVNNVDNPTNISKMLRGTLEDLVSIFGLTKAQIRDMKKKDLVDYLTPRIVFEV
jgi:hypothetical protein